MKLGDRQGLQDERRTMVDGVNGAKPPVAPRPQLDPGARANGPSAPTDAGTRLRIEGGAASFAPGAKGEVGGLVRDLAAKPPVNTAKVAELQQKIQAGNYPIAAERIADAMIAMERGAKVSG